MPLTPSNSLALGTPAPAFSLPDPAGKVVSLADFDGAPALLVAFISNRCPYVKLIREALAAFAADYQPRGLAVVAVNANDFDAHPEETPAKTAEEAAAVGYGFPYLVDADQRVAQAFQAACTPDFFLYDRSRGLYYHGQFDDARPNGATPVTGGDLRAAVDRLLAGEAPPTEQKNSIGCNIKWRPGNEPDAVLPA